MPTPIVQKLKIKAGQSLLTINAPGHFKKALGVLPAGVKMSDAAKAYDQIHWFVLNRTQLEKEMSRVMNWLKPGVIVWVYYPKGSSKIQTDLTRDKGWDCLLAESDKLSWINLISFDSTWSTFGFRAKTGADKLKEAKPKEREIFKWIDPAKKEIRLPEDLASAFKKNKKEAAYFDTLSFTNKKEYLEWVVTAKRDETRTIRIEETIERLGKGWKNPSNRG